MTPENSPSQRIQDRMGWIQEVGAGTIGGAFHLELTDHQDDAGSYTFLACTEDWMRNVIGTLHGGSYAALADQAMGIVANCLFENEPHAPTSQLQLNFHRPMLACDRLLVTVQVVNASRSIIHLSAIITREIAPDKPCVSSSAIFFRTSPEKGGQAHG